MSKQIIDIGTVANDRTGDTWRAALDKTNDNFTELYNFHDATGFIFITQESDFPVQDATTITLESNKVYIPTSDFSTAKRFTCEDGSAFTSLNAFGPTVTYTGSGVMFTGSDASFSISQCTLTCATASEIFDFSETGSSSKLVVMDTVTATSAVKWGTFDKMLAVQVVNCNCQSIEDGITITGNQTILLDLDKFALASTSATFIGLDLGTAIITTIELSNVINIAPAGGIGISGAASSANVATNFLALVSTSAFSGGMAALSGITNEDVRWRFALNTPIADTIEDALLSFNGSSTETVISIINTPVIVNATWTCVRESLFSCTTGGRVTSLSERDITLPIDLAVGLISAGGGAIDVTVYLALNGSVITASATSISISGSNQAFVSIPWQEVLSENDFNEIYIENNTNTTNIIVESGKLRAR